MVRYHLPKKTIKGDCPQCGPRHRKTLSRYIDSQTGEPLPDIYGRCDRENNCAYHLNPYEKGTSGRSYADEVRERERLPPIPKDWFSLAGKLKAKGHTRQQVEQRLIQEKAASVPQAEHIARRLFDKPETHKKHQPDKIYTIPVEVFSASLGHYHKNAFARLLIQQIGEEAATDLLQRFQVGTSAYYPDAAVFWYIDEKSRIRGGQIKQFGNDWHTLKYVDKEGRKRSKTNWAHKALIRRYEARNEPIPDWLIEYDTNAERSPCLFGLPQLLAQPDTKSIAIVEAPKTAILCSHYFPDFIWLATGAKSYLNAERLAPVKGRKLMLYPDLGEKGHLDKCHKNGSPIGWRAIADDLQKQGFQIEVSNILENNATDEHRAAGLDLADFLLLPPVPVVVHTLAYRPLWPLWPLTAC